MKRHKATGNVGLGFVNGLGLKEGAVASTVGHDSHNLTLAGADDRDMLVAAKALVESEGGMVVVREGKALAH